MVICHLIFLKLYSPKLILEELHVTKNNNVLKTYNNSNTEQLVVCIVKLRHIVKCRFFVLLGDNPALLGILDIEVLGILRIIHYANVIMLLYVCMYVG